MISNIFKNRPGLVLLILAVFSFSLHAQELVPEVKGDSVIYHLTIDYKTVNFTGKDVTAMTINNGIPGPTLRFQEGQHAVIKVTNKMTVETSVHWHGLLLPNYMDGIAYLTTPPIRPGKTLTYDFPLTHSGTYWYHSHTGLQEQRGIYGSIVIEPRQKTLEYDKDLVLVLSDWTNENPHHILKNLKRHNEWYGVKIGNAPSLLQSIKTKTLRSQLKLWSMKMPGMHISDIPYDAFLINGEQEQQYDEFKPGEKVRLRVINAGASSYFWLNFAGGDLSIVSADGIDVQPVQSEKVLIGLAETYDFIITVLDGRSLEFQATPQDVTGSASVFIGNGPKEYAPDISKPDYQELGALMAQMHSGNSHDMSLEGNETGIMTAIDHSDMEMDHNTMNHGEGMDKKEHEMNHEKHQMENMDSDMEAEETDDHSGHMMGNISSPMTMWNTGYSNSVLKSQTKTTIHSGDSLRSIVLNLTGNMWRYNWSMNGKTLSESDKIKINKGEVVRITLNNTTMMHHPMHLHGHFFRVLNGNGEYAPLKHTVDVPPMSRITIEFEANEDKDWFFHCHLLYHMKTGMSRIVSYNGSERDSRLAPYPLNNIYKMDRKWFTWGTLEAASQMASYSFTSSNTNNQINFKTEFGWNNNYELTFDYERFVGDYFRVYGGLKSENENHDSLDDHDIAGKLGIRYLLWYVMDTDFSVDHKLRPEISLNSHIPITQRLMAIGHFEWHGDFGAIESLPDEENFEQEITYTAGVEYLLSEQFSFIGNYDNRFGWGAGLMWNF